MNHVERQNRGGSVSAWTIGLLSGCVRPIIDRHIIVAACNRSEAASEFGTCTVDFNMMVTLAAESLTRSALTAARAENARRQR